MSTAKARTAVADFGTKYSSAAVAPAKHVLVVFSQRNLLDAVYWMPKMSQFTKFVPAVPGLRARRMDENLPEIHDAKSKAPASIY
jgi:hypothetical protein